MKKGKFIGLGITALALGVVAGAIGAQKATEVKAEGSGIYLRGGMNSWGTTAAYEFVTTSEVGYEYELKDITIGKDQEWKIADSSWETYNFGYSNITFDVGASCFGESGANVKTVTGGIYDFFIKLPSGGDSNLHVKAVQADDDESTHVFKLLGEGSEGLSWTAGDSVYTFVDSGVAGYLKKIESVVLAANSKFKVYDKNVGGWYAGSFLATDATREKIDFDVDGNFKVLTAGTYDIYIKSAEDGHRIAILTHGEKIGDVKEETPIATDYYILGLGGDWAPRHGVRNDKESGTNIAEFHNVALAANDTFKVVYVENGAAATYYGYDSFVNLPGASDMTGKIEEAATEHNFKVVTAGTYSIYLFDDSGYKVSIVDENYSEVYKAYLNGVEAGQLTVNPSNEHELMLTDVDLTAGEELVIKFNGTPLTVSPKAGDGNNVALSEDKLIVRQTAENVGMYLSQNAMSAWEIWVDGYVTSDIEVVDNFVATYITPYIDEAWKTQTAEQRVASCTEKYNRAKTAFDALTQDQKDLFTVNSRYSDAYAAYSRWASVVGGGAAINIKGMTDASKTAIIVATVSVGAIAAAAGFVFLRKKRNNA